MYYCIVIDCNIVRKIDYDQYGNIITAEVDHCFENLDKFKERLGSRWFNCIHNTDLTPELVIEKNNFINMIVSEMNKSENRLIKNIRLSDNDNCCHYMIFKTSNISSIITKK